MKNIFIKYISIVKRKFNNFPIRKKLTIMITLSCFIPMISIILYSYVQTRSQMISQSKFNIYNTISQVNSNINRKIDSFYQVSTMIYTDTLLKGYLEQDYKKDKDFVDAYHYINSLFYGILAANSDIDSITVYIDNSTLPADLFFIKYQNDPDTADRIRSLDFSVRSDLLVHSYSQANGSRYISFYTILDYANINSPYGILELVVKESVFFNLYAQETHNKDIYVTDAGGIILSSNNKIEIAQGIDTILGLSLTDFPGNEVIMPVNGVNSIIAYAGEFKGLHCISVTPSSLILKEAAATSRQMIMIAILCMLFALYLISRVSGYFSKRFRLLGERIARLENGEFEGGDVREIMGMDEIGQLYQTFNKMSFRLNVLINELYKKEIIKKEFELQLLQSQFNPHFLYNTLAAISSLAIHNEDRETAELSSHLSQFYKTALNKGQWYLSVKKELDITRHYIAVQHKRFKNRFNEIWDINEQALHHTTLKLILQPFVENAISHALPDDLSPVTIKICCHLQGDIIIFIIEDNGIGMDEPTLKALHEGKPETGYGISNTRDRIKLAFGSDCYFHIHSVYGQGTRIEIHHPINCDTHLA